MFELIPRSPCRLSPCPNCQSVCTLQKHLSTGSPAPIVPPSENRTRHGNSRDFKIMHSSRCINSHIDLIFLSTFLSDFIYTDTALICPFDTKGVCRHVLPFTVPDPPQLRQRRHFFAPATVLVILRSHYNLVASRHL